MSSSPKQEQMYGFYKRYILYTFILGIGSYFIFCGAHAGTAKPVLDEDNTSAVILTYFRIGEDAYPESNVRIEQFENHIKELTTEAYNILPLTDIVTALKVGKPLPDKSIAITFEGGYKSAYTNAIPLLKENNIPFTIFFASDMADQNSAQYMNWDDLQNLDRVAEASFGLLPASYALKNPSDKKEILNAVHRARIAAREYLNKPANLFSYPYGETTDELLKTIEDQGFEAAFGQHSGVAHTDNNPMYLPRFVMSEAYADIDRLRMIAAALPLPVSEEQPAVSHLPNPLSGIGFTLSDTLKKNISTLSCYLSDQEDIQQEILGNRRVEIRALSPLTSTRMRLNCTMPAFEDENGEMRWRWFGMLFIQDAAKEEKTPIPQNTALRDSNTL